MYRVSVLWEQMTTTLPISLPDVAGKSADPGYTNSLLELYDKAAWLRLCYLHSKKWKKSGQIGQQAEQKSLSAKKQNPTEMGTQHQRSFLRGISLELGAVGNWARTLGRKELCDSNHKLSIHSRVYTTNIPALKDSEMESFRNTHHASCQADNQSWWCQSVTQSRFNDQKKRKNI